MKFVPEDVCVGIELEGVYNLREVAFNREDVRSYHNGRDCPFGDSWFLETDSSIHCNGNEFGVRDGAMACEIVSAKTNIRRMMDILEEFKEEVVQSTNMSDGVIWDKSTGAHIHFSYGRILPSSFCLTSSLIKLRDMFFEEIDNSSINIDAKKAIKHDYDRSYAQKIKIGDTKIYTDKYSEFNLSHENNRKNTIEWRGLNLHGVKTWEEFFEFWRIVKKCIYMFFQEFVYETQVKNSKIKLDSVKPLQVTRKIAIRLTGKKPTFSCA